jgi:hypothetical protein
VVECLLRAGLDGVVAEPEGLVPMGATELCDLLPAALVRGGESPGDELLVRLDCAAALSKTLLVGGLDCGLEVLLARDRWFAPADWDPGPLSTGG